MATSDSPTLKPPVGERDHVEGPADAQVTLIEYGDYECPHCRQVAPIIEQVLERFGDRLRYVFRHLPISTAHPNAQIAAEAAATQGRFWEMHDRIFEHTGPLTKQQLVRFAGGSAMGTTSVLSAWGTTDLSWAGTGSEKLPRARSTSATSSLSFVRQRSKNPSACRSRAAKAELMGEMGPLVDLDQFQLALPFTWVNGGCHDYQGCWCHDFV
jgi:hypothetical protein